MIPDFEHEKDLLDWVRDRIRESSRQCRDIQVYGAQCRCMDNGIQHINSMGVDERGFHKFAASYEQVAGEPAKAVFNRITNHRIRTAAKLSPQRFEVLAGAPDGIANAEIIARNSAWATLGNIVLEDCRLIDACDRANGERAVDGLHGFGVRLNKWSIGEGRIDGRLESFEFEGNQLSLDPSNKSNNLWNHDYVIFSEVLTKTKAIDVYGEEIMKGIDDESLISVGRLRPTEVAFNRLSGGTLYEDVVRDSRQLGLVVRTVWLKGRAGWFDRMYVIVDTRSVNENAGDRVINMGAPANPYGGMGMPLGLVCGHMRSGTRMPISFVGMMSDDQRKLNQFGSILLQAYWNWVKEYWLIDRRWFTGNTQELSADDIWDMADQGVFFGSSAANGAQAPQLGTTPMPPQHLLDNMELYEQKLRENAFMSDIHQGRAKTHVPTSIAQLAHSEAEAPLHDIERADIEAYERVIQTAVATGAALIHAGAPYMVNQANDKGLNNSQFRTVLSLDVRRPPKLRLTQNALRRQTRSERVQQLYDLLDRGAYPLEEVPKFFADIDMPMTEDDRYAKQYADDVAAKVFAGQTFDPIPMMDRAVFVFSALSRAMMQTDDPEIRGRFIDAFDAQREIEGYGEEEPQEEQPQQPQEVSLQDLVGDQSAGPVTF